RGDWYMIPETAARRTVDLYRASHFPWRWERHATLIPDVRAVDTTVAEIDGRWWLFTCIGPGAQSADELFIYHAETPLGPFVPHRKNPVKSDVRSARPAGRPFHWDGGWYRPAQDCAGRYGRATVMNRIVRIDPDGYEEVDVARIEANWD